MTIQMLLNKICENIGSLNEEEKQTTLNLLIDILNKIHSQGFQHLEPNEFEFINTLLKAKIDEKTDLFTIGLGAVTRELAKRDNKGNRKTPPPSADWSSFGSSKTPEKLYSIFMGAFIKKQLTVEHIIKKASNYGCESFTSREFDFIQEYINTGKYDNQQIKKALIKNYDGIEGLKQQFEDDLLKLSHSIDFLEKIDENSTIFDEIWNHIWIKELFQIACNRLQRIGIIREKSKTATQANALSAIATSKSNPTDLNTPAQFFDLLFHQYHPPETGPFAAKTSLRDHRALFIALVSEAQKSEKNKEAFFKRRDDELKKQFKLNANDNLTDQHISEEVNLSYHDIYAIFDAPSNNQIPGEIIKQLKQYEPTEAGYYAAREKFLRIYNPQTSLIAASEKHRESSASAISTQRDSNKTDEQLTNVIKKSLLKQSTEQSEQKEEKKEHEQEEKQGESAEKKDDDTLDSSSKSNFSHQQLIPSNPDATITISAAQKDHKITPRIVLDSLWGDMNKSDPAADSVCGKALAAWNEKQPHSPAMFPLPEFKFSKPSESDITIENNGNDITINFSATDPSLNKINLNLSRSVDTKKNEETWACQSDSDSINEIKQFELIAAESLALRKEQGVKDAEKIEIMDIGEKDTDKKQSTKFNLRLSDREDALIEAHFRMGYTEITYGNVVLRKTPNDEHASTVSI